MEIAARHPSLKRYLGRKEDAFPGQETKHFNMVLAEIISDALCSKIIERNEEAAPEDYEDADWNWYYSKFSGLMTEFLPIAHKIVLPNP